MGLGNRLALDVGIDAQTFRARNASGYITLDALCREEGFWGYVRTL